MKVILLDNIPGVGQIGDIKNVADGYGRNFLLPRSLAKLATKNSVKETEKLREKWLKQKESLHETAHQVAQALAAVQLQFVVKASTKGTLFDGIGADDIVKKLKEVAGISLEPDNINLPEQIKAVGEYTVEVNLPPELKSSLKVSVVALTKGT